MSRFFEYSLKLAVLVLLAACSPAATPEATVTVTPKPAAVSPYHTPTPTDASAPLMPAPEDTPPPLPTPTPFAYQVVAGDTLLGIALRFGITLEELLAANPQVDPQFMSVGTDLIIPASGQQNPASSLPTATPVALDSQPPDCYPTASGGLWCFWLLHNPGSQAVENVVGRIDLYGAAGEIVASQTALLPLNHLKAGEQMPLLTYFAPPVPAWQAVDGRLLAALEVAAESERYLALEVLSFAVDLQGRQAIVEGNLRLADEQSLAGTVWAVAVAYDQAGRVVGVRRWESSEGLAASGTLPFNISVYSLGLEIEHVSLAVEARP